MARRRKVGEPTDPEKAGRLEWIDINRPPGLVQGGQLLGAERSSPYRAIRDDAFPAVRLHTRYVVPAKAIDQLVNQAIETGSVIDVAKIAAERRTEREFKRLGC
jgi:predicted DNA-binding transcriptional regulator AlpA